MPTTCFVIEDADHAEWQSEHASLPEAWAELARLSEAQWKIPVLGVSAAGAVWAPGTAQPA
jgi:hypothetical protein